jgi:3-deoxy-D-manno-octulosonic-acid transferase
MLPEKGWPLLARSLYTLFLYLSTPLIMLRLLWRSVRAPAYAKRWGERFGIVPLLDAEADTAGPVIWVHAVSVGETLAAIPLIRQLQKQYENAQLVVTTTTPTGSEQVCKVLGDSVYHVYAPYDLPDVLNRFFSRVKPSILIIMETELWPNLIHKCRLSRVPVVVANARLSEKSAAGYKKIAWLVRPMLAEIDIVAAQTTADGDRFQSLGMDKKKLEVTGNIKFDLQLNTQIRESAAALRAQWQGDEGMSGDKRKIWLAASTHRGEEEQILAAFSQILQASPKTLLVLVPRHPERFDEVAKLCVDQHYSMHRRSEGGAMDATVQVLLGDTMGELLNFCGASDIAFVGGSLVPLGGHNLIEPAAWGIPVLTGPHLFNFVEVAAKLDQAGGVKICRNAGELASIAIQLIKNPEMYQAMSDSAATVADSNRGAQLKLMNCLGSLLG